VRTGSGADNRPVNDIEALHARAVAEGRDTYLDPGTEFGVFTSAYLLRLGVCCGSGCRHCPYSFEKAGESFEKENDARTKTR
jgi:hypothetical protein